MIYIAQINDIIDIKTNHASYINCPYINVIGSAAIIPPNIKANIFSPLCKKFIIKFFIGKLANFSLGAL